MPFPLRALQVDSGREFAAEFEAACQRAACACSCFPHVLPNAIAMLRQSSGFDPLCLFDSRLHLKSESLVFLTTRIRRGNLSHIVILRSFSGVN